MKTTIRVHVEIELTVGLTQYNEGQWTITDLKKEARTVAIHKVNEIIGKRDDVRIIGDLKMRFVATEVA